MFDVLPEGSLDGLTAEDLRLLLNGVGDINVAVLISYTSFNDESGESSERLVKFKRWLWSIVEKMTHLERQDLVSKYVCNSNVTQNSSFLIYTRNYNAVLPHISTLLSKKKKKNYYISRFWHMLKTGQFSHNVLILIKDREKLI